MDGNTMVGYRFAAPVFLRPTAVEGERKGRGVDVESGLESISVGP